MRSSIRRILAAALALLLLYSQHAAIAHAIAYHLERASGAATAFDVQSPGHGKATAKSDACDFDGLFVAVLGGIDTAIFQPAAIDASTVDLAAVTFFSFQTANHLAAAPRGPPVPSL